MKKKFVLLFLLFISLFMVTGCSMEDFGIHITNESGLSITKEKYESLSIGDSYSIVKIKLGGSCENYYSSDNENWYTCVDSIDDNKRIVLKFVDGKLEHKSSSGLY